MKDKPKENPFNHNAHSYQGKDNREGRLHDVKTDRGTFRIKENIMEGE